MRDAFLKYWRGILLTAIGAVATIWLALSGQLGLYIHPRYFAFTAIMAGIALVFVLVALILPRQRDDGHAQDHDHDHEVEPRARPAWRARLAVASSAVLLLATAAALLALPPTTLSTSLADGRDLSASGVVGENAIELASADPASFTVKDWAVLIADGASGSVLQDASPRIVGFVIADPETPETTFAVARYVMTCCAVDAQPVGIRVELPGWQERFADGAWVEVGGRFAQAGDGWVLRAESVETIEQPAEPYVY